MIMLDNEVFRARRTYSVQGYRECIALLDSLPQWAMPHPPRELEQLEEALVADYHAALVIYDLLREHAYVLLQAPIRSVRLEADLPMTFCYRDTPRAEGRPDDPRPGKTPLIA